MRQVDEQRGDLARLCEAVGVDPARAIDVEWRSDHPKKVRITILDGPTPEDRHTEDHRVPDGWQ